MVDPKASRFWQAALQSGLIDEDGLQACFAAIAPHKRVPEHIDRRLARQAIQQGKLTVWQAQQLLAGRSTGFKINRYTLLEMIGQGGMGRVYLARDTRLNRRVALKILSPERMHIPRAIARFQREARVGAQLQHENLVRIYDEGEANGKCYLVMEYIEGKNIGAIIAEDGPIPPATAARLAQQVALGLEHAHQKGLIHRDVNPYNILVTRDGVAKLTDLGLAIDQAEQAQVTREGATVGTFDYVSPEQARHSHSVDTRSDIYSLGCTLYHMLTGQVPFPSPSLPEKLYGHQAIDPPPVARLVPGIPEGLSRVVEKMMRKSPDERYANPRELAQALDPYTDNPSGPPYASHGAAGFRGVGRSSMTETQVVDPSPDADRPISPAAAMGTQAFPTAPGPSPPASGAPSAAPATATGGGSTSQSDENWANLALGINLGPEPSLTEGLQSGRKKSKPTSWTSPPSTGTGIEPGDNGLAAAWPGLGPTLGSNSGSSSSPSAETTAKVGIDVGVDADDDGAYAPTESSMGRRLSPSRRWWLGAGAIGVGTAVAGILFGLGLIGQAGSDGAGGAKRSLASASASAIAPGPAATTTSTSPRGASRVTVPDDRPFAVQTGDGTVLAEASLKGAIQRAIGSKGHVLLGGRAPIRLSDPALIAGGGRLVLRAAEGARPVIEVEMSGQKPFLETRTDTPLTIVGVTIVARYHGRPKEVPAPALIQAEGDLTLERCAFAARGAVRGARAVVAEGRNLTVVGCWFEGFAKALDVACFNGSIKQSMIVRAETGADSAPLGWAVRVRKMPAGKAAKRPQRRLAVDHVTVRAKGLLELVGFGPGAPLQVRLTESAIRADALLAWEPAKPGIPLTPALDWRGERNLYEIRDKSWVVLKPEGAPGLPDGPVDLASWRATVDERDCVPPPLRFRAAPGSLSQAPRPDDFAVIEPETRPPGADPAQVGPAPGGADLMTRRR